MRFPAAIQNLIDYFSKLPTVGPKTAERYAFYLLKQDAEELQKFAQAIAELKEKTTICQTCLAVSETNPCTICLDKNRNKKQICLVADSRDMLVVEATKQFNGLYFVLGGLLNTIAGVGPEQLNVKQLISRLKSSQIAEIILALNPNLEGETTILYIVKLIKSLNLKIKITRLAKGLPSGSDLEYADEITLANALKYRNEM
ncbi:recombination protein RecR [Candidatus Falkowbacteria bacterium CG_4_9_14_3_um_filter_38_19]|uniref:Recombination protein RecR n=2 Tax=Candidatus Falkowiibacteriota TaxID=1752728 RepID=A0A2M6WPX3_9BACT|nr:recombination protein RecR [Candidatus Falkowbacteria bacterium]PIT94861.1 MAG: recombination protein RecR [Candidatus Falkowbacteria bacterium CG10_big_fil_rev_8_21_14_0_10_38_22]PJB15738.1 MAG: recombination protein RecR [Candidatus Falkowbacteria bacterium CG_4_9_14_3_um_filter_38_19]